MLSGTELNYAYGIEFDPLPKESAKQRSAPPKEEVKKVDLAPPNPSSLDPTFLTSDQKLHILSAELQKQKELFENNKGSTYIDKLISKKKDIIKLVIFSFVILLALSFHDLLTHYLKKYLEESILSSGQEFALRLLYPALVLLTLWNIRAFNK